MRGWFSNRLACALMLALTAGAARAEATCRADAFGNLVCRPGAVTGRPALPEQRRLDPEGFAVLPAPGATPRTFLPSARVDRFGTARLKRRAANRKGLAISPRRGVLRCQPDVLGNFSCR